MSHVSQRQQCASVIMLSRLSRLSFIICCLLLLFQLPSTRLVSDASADSGSPTTPIDDSLFDYRTHGQRISIYDWSDGGDYLLDQPFGAEMLDIIKRRSHFWIEDVRAPDEFLLSPSSSVKTLTQCNLSYYSYINDLAARPITEDAESAFLHAADPACLSVFMVPGGVELHWQPDRRLDYARHSGSAVLPAYRVYRTKISTSERVRVFSVGESVQPPDPVQLNQHMSYMDAPSEAGAYRYEVVSLRDDEELSYSWPIEVSYPPSSYPSQSYWVERMYFAVSSSSNLTYTGQLSVRLGCKSATLPPNVRMSLWLPSQGYGSAAFTLEQLAPVAAGSGYWQYSYASSSQTFNASFCAGHAVAFEVETAPGQWTALLGQQRYTSTPNNRLRNRVYATYIMNRTSPVWHEAWAAQAAANMAPPSRPGCTYSGMYGDSGVPFSIGEGVHPAYDMNEEACKASLLTMLQAEHALLAQQNKVLLINGLCDPWYLSNEEWDDHVDGVLQEGFVIHGHDSGWTESYLSQKWVQRLEWFRNAAWRFNNDPNKADGSVIALAQADRDSIEARLFALASYLMIVRPIHATASICARQMDYADESGALADLRPAYYPEFQVSLGIPLPGNTTIEFPASCLTGTSGECEAAIAASPVLVRHYEHGMVVVNYRDFQHWDPEHEKSGALAGVAPYRSDTKVWYEYEDGPQMYRLFADDKTLPQGGRIWTEPVTGEGAWIWGREAMILLYQPIRSPEIDHRALYPLYSDAGVQSVFCVHASHWSGERMWVEIDAEAVGVSDPVVLRDDGVGNDSCADDGIYTSAPIGLTGASNGTYELQCYARGDDGISAYQSVQCRVIGAPPAKYVNATAGGGDNRGLTYSGIPYSSVTLDYDVDGKDDLLVSIRDEQGHLYKRSNVSAEALPNYMDFTYDAFGSALDRGIRGIACAALGNEDRSSVFMAHRTSPRLYAHNGIVYPNTGSGFIEIGQYFELPSLADDSWCGAWGDYDGDGYADLFIGRGRTKAGHGSNPRYDIEEGLPGVLLRSRAAEGGIFQNVSSILGEAADRLAAATTAAWGDVNGDGTLDLFVGQLSAGAQTLPELPEFRPMGGVSTESPPSRLFVQQGDGMFVEELQQRLVDGNTGWVMSSKWADIDLDGDEDLVLAGAQGVSWLRNNGASMACEDLPYWTSARGAATMDFDLDGRSDILALPDSIGANVIALYWNKAVPLGEPYFADVAPWMGIDECGESGVDGISISDFNQDGDQDFYLGKPVSSNALLFQNRRADDSTDSPVNHWVGVKLTGGGAGDNLAAIGAVVTVQGQRQRVDGGSGRGGQNPRALIFGLGEYGGSTIGAEVKWPNGVTQAATLTVGLVNDVLDAGRDPQIQATSLSAVNEPYPGLGSIWVFRWATLYPTVASKDSVRVKSTYDSNPDPAPCDIGQYITLLADGVPGVTVLPVELGQDGLYWHELRWDRGFGVCVGGCSYWYRVFSESLVQKKRCPTGADTWKKLSIPVCINEEPDPNQP